MKNILLYLIIFIIIYVFYRTFFKETMQNSDLNILGTPLTPCCPTGKVTGFYRDGTGKYRY